MSLPRETYRETDKETFRERGRALSPSIIRFALIAATLSASYLAQASPLLVPVKAGEVEAPPRLSGATSASGAAIKKPLAEVKSLSIRDRHIMAIDRALAGDVKASEEILKSLLSANPSADERDRLLLTLGRVEYQAGDDENAVAAYKQIRIGSDSWLEALEESASAQMRLGHPLVAMAQLKTVLTPYFQDRVSSEPYYLIALANLRVCDYRSVFRILDLFKSRFRSRVKEWENAKANPVVQNNLREVKMTIQKLNLVEAEAIQRLYMDESGKPLAGSVPKISRGSNQLYFPADPDVDSKEVWLDEIDHYRVNTKGCPAGDEDEDDNTPVAVPAKTIAKGSQPATANK